MALFKKKAAPQVEEPMDLDAVMKKYDRESMSVSGKAPPVWWLTFSWQCFPCSLSM